MSLLPNDKDFLDKHNFNYEIHESTCETILIINNYQLSSMFDLNETQVLVKIPNAYPAAKLDMFWVYPYIKLKDTNTWPTQADYFNDTFLGHIWQRFSRHYEWKLSYSLSTHLNIIKDVLVNGRG